MEEKHDYRKELFYEQKNGYDKGKQHCAGDDEGLDTAITLFSPFSRWLWTAPRLGRVIAAGSAHSISRVSARYL